MAALRTRRSWWARHDAHALADAPLFRVFARRWKPLAHVRAESPSALPLAPAEEPRVSRAWFSHKPRHIVIAGAKEKPRQAWNPWLWVK